MLVWVSEWHAAFVCSVIGIQLCMVQHASIGIDSRIHLLLVHSQVPAKINDDLNEAECSDRTWSMNFNYTTLFAYYFFYSTSNLVPARVIEIHCFAVEDFSKTDYYILKLNTFCFQNIYDASKSKWASSYTTLVFCFQNKYSHNMIVNGKQYKLQYKPCHQWGCSNKLLLPTVSVWVHLILYYGCRYLRWSTSVNRYCWFDYRRYSVVCIYMMLHCMHACSTTVPREHPVYDQGWF